MDLTGIRNIYCVGRNYRQHAAELGNAVPSEPMIFTKPTHALIAMDGGDIVLPGKMGEVHYEAELVLHVARSYEQGLTAGDLVDKIALGIDFTLRDVQSELKGKGHPWLKAKGFLNSAAVTEDVSFPGEDTVRQMTFSLCKNGEEVQQGTPEAMIFGLSTITEFIGRNYGLGAGDLIYTGTPAGVGAVQHGDRLELILDGNNLGSATIKFR